MRYNKLVIVEVIKVEKKIAELIISENIKMPLELKIGIIKDSRSSKSIKINNIILFNAPMPITPNLLPTKVGLNDKAKHIEIIYTHEIKCILKDDDIKKYNLDLGAEYEEALQLSRYT